MADIDELQIKIKADSAKASDSIDKLASSLDSLGKSLSFDTSKLSNIASGIRSMSDAATGFKGAKSKEITSLATALSKFSNVDTSSFYGISAAMKNLAAGMKDTKMIDASGILNTASALSKMGGKLATVGTDNLVKIKDDLAYFVKGMNSVGALNFDTTGLTNLIGSISRLGGKISTQATANLPQISAQLQNFVRQMNKIGELKFDMTNMSSLVTSISRLGSVASGRAVNNIPLLADNLKYLFETLSKAPNVSANIIRMTEALANLAKTGASSGRAATSLGKSLNIFSGSANKAKSSSFSLASAFGKLYASYWLLFRAFSKIKDAIDISSSLTEVENVVRTTFGNYEKLIQDFSKTSIQDFGMSELTAKQVASRFQAMGTAMGFSQGKMADMSLQLTKLTADMASFYDMEQSDVARNLQAVFTGETEPLRKYGLDLTQATLKEWAMKQGLDADISSMTQAEKTMLRYQYVMANTAAAQGDFARTADTWANQVRILKQSFEQLAAIIGGALINAFKPFVQTLNAVMQKVIAFATTVTNALGSIFGWKFEISAGGFADDWSDAAGSAADIADSTGQAAKNVEKMNKGLRAFDELNLITTPDNSSGSGSGGSGGGGASGGGASGGLVQVDTIFKDYESQIRSLRELGAYISDALSDAMESIDWDRIYSKARNFGKGLADFLNGLITPRLFGDVGMTIASALNTAIYTALSFGEEFDWTNLGDSIAAGVNRFFETFDFSALGRTINTWVHGIYDTITTAIGNIKWSEVWDGVTDFLSEIDLETISLIIGAFALKYAGKFLTGKILKETIEKLISEKFVAAFGQESVKSILSYIVPISLSVAVGALTFTIGKDSIKKDAENLVKAYKDGGFLQYLQESLKQLINPFEWINAYGGGILSQKGILESYSDGVDLNIKMPKKEDYASLDEYQKALNDFNNNVPDSLKVPSSFDLKAWIDEWKQMNGLDNVDLRAEVVLPNLREKISGFKEKIKEWWGLNVELPVHNKLTTTQNDISLWWENVKEYWGEKKLSIQTEIGEIKGKIEEKWNEASEYIQENILPWFTKDHWLEIGNGIKEGLSTKWEEFSTWWSDTGIAVWWNEKVSPWFTEDTWKNLGESIRKGLSKKWEEFTGWWENTGFYKWWNQDVAPKFTTDKWTFSGISDGLKNAWNNAIAAVKHIWNGFANWMNSKLSFSWDAVNIAGKQIVGAGSINLGKIPTFAAGGFPSQYSMFMAGENGRAEMLGTVGGKTAVAGGQEITGIRDAVYSTAQQEMELLRQQNQLLQGILEKEFGITSEQIGKSARNYAKDYFNRTGREAYIF
jgi:CII-binding regulator of phage lambda lysogenization HflD